MISASRCKLPSNGAGACARAGMVAATTLTRAAMIKRRAIGFRLRGNRAAAGAPQGEMSYYKPTERWPRMPFSGPSVDGRQPLERGGHNARKSGRCFQRGDLTLINPAPLTQLLIEHWLARDPSRRKRQDHEMALHAVLLIAHDCFAEARQCDRLNSEARFLAHFTRYRLVQGLTDLHHPARQAEQAPSGGIGAPHHQDLSVTHDGGAGGQEGPVWIASGVGHR